MRSYSLHHTSLKLILRSFYAVADEYFPSSGSSLYITFEDGKQIYANRQSLSEIDERVSGLSDKSPYIAQPDSDSTYQNVMAGLKSYLDAYAPVIALNTTIGEDGWPVNYDDFVTILSAYVSIPFGPGAAYAQV